MFLLILLTMFKLHYNKILKRRLQFIRYSQIGIKLPIYYDLLDAIVDICKARVKAHHQNTLGIVGRTSSGKSTLAVNFAYKFDDFFRIEGNYIINKADLAEKLSHDLTTVSPVNLFDEASIILNSLRHSSKEAADLTTLFDICRSWEMTSIFCAPKLRTINNRIRDDHIDFLLTCGRTPLYGYDPRTFFCLYMRTESNPFADSVFWKPVAWGVCPPKMPKALYEEYMPMKKLTQDRYRQQLIEQYIEKDEEEDEI